MKYTVIQDNFVCLWNVFLFCRINYNYYENMWGWEGRQR